MRGRSIEFRGWCSLAVDSQRSRMWVLGAQEEEVGDCY